MYFCVFCLSPGITFDLNKVILKWLILTDERETSAQHLAFSFHVTGYCMAQTCFFLARIYPCHFHKKKIVSLFYLCHSRLPSVSSWWPWFYMPHVTYCFSYLVINSLSTPHHYISILPMPSITCCLGQGPLIWLALCSKPPVSLDLQVLKGCKTLAPK